MLRIPKYSTCFALMLLASSASAQPQGSYVLKVGTLAPKGSTWERVVADSFNEINQLTSGKMKFQMYAGGVLGDEKDMVRKMRIGQLDGGGFTVLGAEEIAPEVSILELPFLFNSLQEVDQVRAFMKEELGKLFLERGFILLSLIDQAGFIQAYSKEKVTNLADIRRQKPWVWAGAKVHYETWKAMDINPTPLPVPEVLSGLQTGLVNFITTTPLACVALQWYTQVKYVFKVDLRYEPGVVVIAKKPFDALPKEYRDIILQVNAKYQPSIIQVAREDDEKALFGMRKKGIGIVIPTKEARDEMIKLTKNSVPEALIRDKFFTRELYEKVLTRLSRPMGG
ncbi:MAG: TRAP transporter substrate-binding protein DctP [Nitrospirae bacterium]|nr:TRAP transporter substrate-binding protein DctP [Nitrospirota bacterium]